MMMSTTSCLQDYQEDSENFNNKFNTGLGNHCGYKLCCIHCVPTVSWMETTSSEVETIQSSLQSAMSMLKTVLDTQTARVQVHNNHTVYHNAFLFLDGL